MKRMNYKVPRDDQARLIVPCPADLPRVVSDNRRLLGEYHFNVLGRSAGELRRQARENLLSIPHSCIRQSGLDFAGTGDHVNAASPLILTGHQPELFHPGVWLKNFLAGNLAAAVGGVSVNLNVDNDRPHQTAIKAPVTLAGGKAMRIEATYLDAHDGRAYEELSEQAIRRDVPQELKKQGLDDTLFAALADYWQRIDDAPFRGDYSRTVTCARHRLELEAGLTNMEALVSDLARTESYRAFILDIVCRARHFHDIYNAALKEFRRVHHIRNEAQPLPNLGREGNRRFELPFWIWHKGQPRQRLWLEFRPGGGRLLQLDADQSATIELSAADLQGRGCCAIGKLDAAEASGLKIRPRALTLTMFARVLLGDVFIHGVGGALYDKVTDEIIRNYWNVEPPLAVMATGTLHLVKGRQLAGENERRQLLRRLRDIRCNADRLLPAAIRNSPLVRDLLARKRQLITGMKELPGDRRRSAWHELHRINAALADQLPHEPEATRQALETVREQISYSAILKDREYSLALHPRERMIEFYRRVTAVNSEPETEA